MRQFLEERLTRATAVRMAIAAVLLTIAGPFGTYSDLSAIPRFVYWSILMPVVGLPMILGIGLILHHNRTPQLGLLPAILIGGALGALPGALGVMLLQSLMRSHAMPFDAVTFMQLCSQVWVIAVAIGIGEEAIRNRQQQAHKPATPAKKDAPPAPPISTTRLQTRLRDMGVQAADIISLSMQDHYVEVSTDTGRHLVLLRLTDAIAELDGLAGLRLHRSHWAARAHLDRIERRAQRWYVALSNGDELPVSKTYLEDVQAALDAKHA